MNKLYIIIPAFNEEENIETVALEWHNIVENINTESKLVIIDDGSKDSTYVKLQELSTKLPQLIALTKKNSGHGGTILYGYQYALEQQANYIFQTDSDGQTVPSEFYGLWEKRKEYDIQIGYRKHRQDGLSRIFVTKILKLVLFFSFGLWIKDANTPFRLMSAETLAIHIKKIPNEYNLSNVLLTVLYEKSKSRCRYAKITFKPRQGGVNSINLKKISKIGWKALKDFASLKKNVNVG